MRRFTALIHIEVDDDLLAKPKDGATIHQVMAISSGNKALISAGLKDAMILDIDNDPGPVKGLEISHSSIHEWDDEYGEGPVVYIP